MGGVEIRSVPWTIKYKPKTLKEVIGNRDGIGKVVSWLKSWGMEQPKKRALLIYGPPGVGKTGAVEAASRDLTLELVESNASDYRRDLDIKGLVGLASQYLTLTGKGRLILLDEVDGISGTVDRGGLKAILDVIKNSRCPIVLTANNIFDPRFIPLREVCLLVEFKRPSNKDVVSHLRRICISEGIEADDDALKFIAERSNGDVRSAVNDLQAVAQGLCKLTMDDILWLGYRNRKEEVFQALRKIFHSKDCLTAKDAVDVTDLDLDTIFEWIYENAPLQLSNPYELAEAMNSLALADIYRNRIVKTQRWTLLRYVIDLMTAGVALSRVSEMGKWVPFHFPQRIKLLFSTKKEREILSRLGVKIGRKCHVSSYVAIKDILPYLRIIFKSNRYMAQSLSKWLDLEDYMVDYILET
ncbi:MAG: replication factor C large subunit [Candidatus Bathyarchaeia archaeon]